MRGKSMVSRKHVILGVVGTTCMLIIAVMVALLTAVLISVVRKKNRCKAMSGKTWDTNTPLIIVTSHFKENLDWLKAAKVPVHVCHKEGGAEFDRSVATGGVTVLPNTGHEAGAYLGFIIKYYDNLPQHVAFIHGHQTAWHQSHDLLDWIHRANFRDHAYISLNQKTWRCTREDKEDWKIIAPYMDTLWDAHFRPFLHTDRPPHLKGDCCAQFVISRDRILRLPLAAYEDWQRLLATQHESARQYYASFGHVWGKDGTGALGTMFESMWHFIFGEDAEMVQPAGIGCHGKPANCTRAP